MRIPSYKIAVTDLLTDPQPIPPIPHIPSDGGMGWDVVGWGGMGWDGVGWGGMGWDGVGWGGMGFMGWDGVRYT